MELYSGIVVVPDVDKINQIWATALSFPAGWIWPIPRSMWAG